MSNVIAFGTDWARKSMLITGCDGNDAKVQTDVRAYITKDCAKRKVTFKAKKPSLQALLLKFMFDDGTTKDCKRVSSYVRVFILATPLVTFLIFLIIFL